MLALFLKFCCENESVNSVKLLPLNMRSKNLRQKHPNIIESNDCILQIFAFIFLLPINHFWNELNPKIVNVSRIINIQELFSEFLLICTNQDL